MLRAYVRTAWRQLRAHRQFTVLNIVGLSIGMAVAVLIGLWVTDEVRYDRWHANYSSIADVRQWETYNGRTLVRAARANPVDCLRNE